MSEMRTYQVGDTWRMEAQEMDVTSSHRVDERWQHTDAQGHLHCWYDEGAPVTSYDAEKHYTVPTLAYVIDRPQWRDGEKVACGHYECRLCREHVKPGYTSDTMRQYIAGMRSYWINDVSVSGREFGAWKASFLAYHEQAKVQ